MIYTFWKNFWTHESGTKMATCLVIKIASSNNFPDSYNVKLEQFSWVSTIFYTFQHWEKLTFAQIYFQGKKTQFCEPLAYKHTNHSHQ